jgi:hypothetical protein
LSKRPLILSAALTLVFAGWLWHAGLAGQWLDSWQRVPPLLWLAMVMGMGVSYGLRAWRIRREFADVPGMRWTLALRIVLAHTAMVNVLPMRTGELGFPWLMRRALHVTWLDASASLLWLRLQDACVLATLALWVWPGLGLALRFSLTSGLWWALWLGVRWVRRHAAQTPDATADGAHAPGLLHKVTRALSRRGHGLMQGWLITTANWALKLSLQAWLLGQLLGQDWSIGWAGSLGAELSALLPVQGLAGVGSYEAGAAAALRWHGVDWTAGLQAALSMHLVVLACSLGFGALAWWLPKPLVTRHNAS